MRILIQSPAKSKSGQAALNSGPVRQALFIQQLRFHFTATPRPTKNVSAQDRGALVAEWTCVIARAAPRNRIGT